jgi:hypothetical protein
MILTLYREEFDLVDLYCYDYYYFFYDCDVFLFEDFNYFFI